MIKRSFLLIPVLLFSACSLTQGPPAKLTPTSGKQGASTFLPDVPPDAWEPLEARQRELPFRELDRSELGGDLGVREPFPEYNRKPISPSARIFLIAGSASDASYLQEIVVLRDYWLKEGYTADQIVCYYVKPEKADYLADKKRFDSMATRTAGFYLAAPHVLFRDLMILGAQNPTSVCLYVNGAGKAPTKGSAEEVALAAQYPSFAGSYRIVLRGGPSGHMNERMRLEALRDGIDAHYLIFNSEFLSEALRTLPPICEKFIVLNADYSGGFLTTALGEDGSLRTVPNTLVLTSARYDRKNLNEGGEMTQFGGLFLSALSSGSGPVERRSWRALANEMIVSVDKVEQKSGVPQGERSRPFYFSNIGRESGPMASPAAEVATAESTTEPVPAEKRSWASSAEPPAPKAAAEPPVSRPATERKGTIEIEVAAPPTASRKPVPAESAKIAPVELKAPQWLKGLTLPKPIVSESEEADGPSGAPKAVVSPRSPGAFGMGRSGFGR